MSFAKKEEYTALFLQTFVCNALSKVLCTIFGPHQWGLGLSLLRFFNHEHIKIIIFVLHTLSVRGLRLEWQNLLEYFPTIWFAGCKILSHGHQYQFLFLCTVYCTVSVYNVLYCFCVQCTVLFLCTCTVEKRIITICRDQLQFQNHLITLNIKQLVLKCSYALFIKVEPKITKY